MKNDLAFIGARIIDGTGKPEFEGSVAIRGDKVTEIGPAYPTNLEADRVIDLEGKMLCPGFIDAHGHGDTAVIGEPQYEGRLGQGITTEVSGNCGITPAPLASSGKLRDDWILYSEYVLGGYPITWRWSSFDSYLTEVSSRPIGINVCPLVGHCTIRASVCGFERRPASSSEIDEMKHRVRESMEAGAWGMSTGLGYPPGAWADTEELISLSEVVSEFDGIYATHMRNEGAYLLKSISEALEIGRKAGVRVQISHFKSGGPKYWGKVREALAVLEDQASKGFPVTADFYPYTGGSGYLSAYIPVELWDGGPEVLFERLADEKCLSHLESTMAVESVSAAVVRGVARPEDKKFIDRNVGEIAKMLGTDPVRALAGLVRNNRGCVLMTTFGSIAEDDIACVAKSRITMLGSDGLPTYEARPHPRTYGAFTKFLNKYVNQDHLLPWEEAIRKITSLPANTFGLTGRGSIFEGARADLVVIDPSLLDDGSSMEEPRRHSPGIRFVTVNGKLALEEGRLTKVLAGQVLRHTVS